MVGAEGGLESVRRPAELVHGGGPRSFPVRRRAEARRLEGEPAVPGQVLHQPQGLQDGH